ncbi:MAG: GNAT family N-acetyltransferase [Acidimicrobiia bacterium]
MAFRSEELREPHDCTQFVSGNPDLDAWLSDCALHASAMNTGRTFVWHAGDGVVVAYVTLAAHLVDRQTVSKRAGRGSPSVIPAILLARLALDSSLQGQGLGAELLWDALSRAIAANRQAAARLVVVDAVDGTAASFYRRFGFEPIPGNELRLVQKLSSIEAALEP